MIKTFRSPLLALAPALVAGCAPAAPGPYPPPDAKAAVEAISREVNSGEAEAARARDGASLELGRSLEDARGWMESGREHEGAGRPGRAAWYYKQVADLFPGQPIGDEAAVRLEACRKAAGYAD